MIYLNWIYRVNFVRQRKEKKKKKIKDRISTDGSQITTNFIENELYIQFTYV